MAKYNYDKKALKGLTPFPFLGEVKTRTAAIEAAPATLPKSVYNPNILAKRLHPAVQHCLIQKVEDHGDAKSFTLVPDAAKGTKEMAYFRASQYVSVALNIDGAPVHKPYTIRSNPKDALGTEGTSYTLTTPPPGSWRTGRKGTQWISPAPWAISTIRICATRSRSSPLRVAPVSHPSIPWRLPS